MNDVWLVLRLVDVFLYCGVVSGLIMHWRYFGRLDRLPGFRWGLVGLFIALTYGVVEIMFKNLPGGFRLIPVTVFLAVLFTSLYLRPVQHAMKKLGRRRG